MATAPYGIRLLVGAATLAIEETKKLPQTILTYPMTLASQAAHLVMLWQQSLADLVNKGDATLEALFPPKDEQPEWATFDEDLDDTDQLGGTAPGVNGDSADADRRSEGRFALYSDTVGSDAVGAPPEPTTTPAATRTRAPGPAPQIVTELDYPTLTLAQLRARLRSLSIEDLQALLAYEEATTARAPFQTLLANRITHVAAK